VELTFIFRGLKIHKYLSSVSPGSSIDGVVLRHRELSLEQDDVYEFSYFADEPYNKSWMSSGILKKIN